MNGREEFATQRRGALDHAEAYLQAAVDEAVAKWGDAHWYEPLLQRAEDLFDKQYRADGGRVNDLADRDRFAKALAKSLEKTSEPGKITAATLARYVANAAVNSAAVSAAIHDPEAHTLELEWVTMHDDKVRHTHQAADGQRVKLGSPFHVGGAELAFPGDTSAPIEEWINCRCQARPDKADNSQALAPGLAGLNTFAVTEPEQKPAVIVALPHPDDPVNSMGPEQSHVTLVYLGRDVDTEPMKQHVADVAASLQPYGDQVSGRGTLGADEAQVLLLDGDGAVQARNKLLERGPILDAHHAAEQYPTFVPHLTLGYPGDGDISDEKPESIQFDRLALWHGDDQTEYPLGGDMTKPNDAAPADQPVEQQAASVDEPLLGAPIPWHGVLAPEGAPSGDKRSFVKGALRNRDLPLPVTWQKASAPGHSGSIATARMDQIARIQGEGDQPNEIRAHGVFLQSVPESDEVVGLIGELGRIGVSVDLDDSTMTALANEDGEPEGMEFSDARICSASMLPIPAFAQAWVALGPPPPGFMGEEAAAVDPEEPGEDPAEEKSETPAEEKQEEDQEFAVSEKPWDGSASRFTPDQWKQSTLIHLDDSDNKSSHKLPVKEPDGALSRAGVHAAAARVNQVDAPDEHKAKAKSQLRGHYKTLGETPPDHIAGTSASDDVEEFGRGPGWVTNPRATSRIHDYWTVAGQEGYDKIGWGTEGDFNRCRVEVGQEIGEKSPEKLRFLNQICAQWQHDAIGVWPGKHEKLSLTEGLAPINLTAAAAQDPKWTPPPEWFSDIALTQLTRTTFVEHENGTEVYGHLAEWNNCHTGFPGVCVTAPHNIDGKYSFFHQTSGGVMTTGGLVEAGVLTVGGGHADTSMDWRPALAHYDSTSTVAAYVRVGEDEFGIWFHGWLLPSLSDEDRVKFRASKLSGDWRMVNGRQELMLGLGVNLGGFTLNPATSVVGGQQVGLVAAGVLHEEVEQESEVDKLVTEVANELTARQVRAAELAAMIDEFEADPGTLLAEVVSAGLEDD